MYSDNLEAMIKMVDVDYNSKVRRKQYLLEKQESIESNIKSLNLEVFQEVNVFLQKLSEERRQAACNLFTDLGTEALKYSLGDQYEMVIEMKPIRNKPNALIWIKDTDTGILTDPMDENGGGLVDIISMALRWVMLINLDQSNDGPIIMDEPFKMVSKEFVPLVTNFIKKLSEEFDRQVIMVTHNEHLAESCDNIIYVQKINGVSEVTVK